MKFQILLILAITLLSAETKSLHIQGVNNNGHSYLNKSDNWFDKTPPTINLRELISNEGTNSNRDHECGDPDACNYNPEAEGYEDCMYPEDYGWCDCDGTYYDCAGECGGSDDSCTRMLPDEMGFYENNDCTGELINEIEGCCGIDGDCADGIFNESGCLDIGGLWLPGDICYDIEIDYSNETDCIALGGIYVPEYNACMILTANEISTIDECLCGEGGVFDEDYWECIEGEEQEDVHWVETEEIFGVGDGPPALYFYDDFTYSEVCDYYCEFDYIPSADECEYAGGEYEDQSGCEFDGEEPSEYDCEYAGGDYHEYSWCELDEEPSENDCEDANGEWWEEYGCDFNEQISEEDCDSVGGDYSSWGFCHLGDDIAEDDCLDSEGEWHSWTECIFVEYEGCCVIDGGDCGDGIVNESGCLDIEAFWLPGDTCYEAEVDYYANETDCIALGGIYVPEYNACMILTANEFSTIDECVCGEGGVLDEDTYECIEGEEQEAFWIETNELPSAEECIDAGGWYDYGEDWCHITDEEACNDLYGYLSVEYYCYAPDMEVCDTLNGEWDGSSDCSVGEDSDACYTLGGEWWEDSDCFVGNEDTCNGLGGSWEEETECYTENEEVCDALGGYWDEDIECEVEYEEVCNSLYGMWYEGLCPSGNYSTDEDVITVTCLGGCPGDTEEMIGTIYFDAYGDWTELEFGISGWWDEGCLGFTLTSVSSMGIVEETGLIPGDMSIQNIYPNPFNPVSTISFAVPENGKVGMTVYNLRGEQVAELMKGEYLNAGYHEIAWDASNYSSGIYFVTLHSGDKFQTKKLTLLK